MFEQFKRKKPALLEKPSVGIEGSSGGAQAEAFPGETQMLHAAQGLEAEILALELKKKQVRPPVSAAEMVNVTTEGSHSILELWGKMCMEEPRLQSLYPLFTELDRYLRECLIEPPQEQKKGKAPRPRIPTKLAKNIFDVAQADPGRFAISGVQKFAEAHIANINARLKAIRQEANRIIQQLKKEEGAAAAKDDETTRLITLAQPLSTRRGLFLSLQKGFQIEKDGDQAVDSFFEVYDRAADAVLAPTFDKSSFRTFKDGEVLLKLPSDASVSYWPHPEGVIVRRNGELLLNGVRSICMVDETVKDNDIQPHPEGVVVRRGDAFYLNNKTEIARGPFTDWTVNARGDVTRYSFKQKRDALSATLFRNDERVLGGERFYFVKLTTIENGMTGIVVRTTVRYAGSFEYFYAGRYVQKYFTSDESSEETLITPSLNMIRIKPDSGQYWMDRHLIYENKGTMKSFVLHPDGMIVLEQNGDHLQLVMHTYNKSE